MFAAVALVAYLVQPGDTLSGIAASHGASLAAVEAANPQFANPNLIYVGQTVKIPEGSSAAQGYTAPSGASQGSSAQYSAPSYSSPSSTAGTTSQASASGSAGYSASSSG